MQVTGIRKDEERWVIETADNTYFIEELNPQDRAKVYYFFSANQLREECDFLTKTANWYAKKWAEYKRQDDYDMAIKLRDPADELEAFLVNGGSKHG